eukprot:TRINITY_DN3661_c0_g1_i1.p1 TRINITY_DN3661_c0_g1~~TRINITY_DN3661_c0_g1_i1.p1  ORF type:complete len:437 (+),score=87.38 TRINITY_DN3661_c0_g1_i1:1209-2519(+)
MEEFKDVMLSEPPMKGYVSGAGGQSRSFENYKGILLCDRPSDHRMVVGVAEQPFLPPGRAERDLFGMPGRGEEGCLGLQPSHEAVNRNSVAKQSRAENSKNVAPTALSRHRKWLKSLSEATKRLKLDSIEAAINKDTQQKKFQEKERLKRQSFRLAQSQHSGDLHAQAQAAMSGTPPAPLNPSPPASSRSEGAGSLPGISPSSTVGEQKRPKTSKPKPKWAMTEDEAFESEMKDAQKLVDFAANLDFEKFIEDYEIREALSIMRQRVDELEAKKEKERDKENVADDQSECSGLQDEMGDTGERLKKMKVQKAGRRHAQAGRHANDKEWDSSSVVDEVSKLIGDDALRLAEYVLSKSESLKQVHSRQSLARLLQDIAVNKNITLPVEMPVSAEICNPVIADIGANATSLKQKRILTDLKNSKDYVQNLPYLYRCPSI